MKSTGKSLKSLEKSLNSTILCRTALLIETDISVKLLCLYLVQHMLHQILVQKFYNNFLILMSPLSQSSIAEVEF